MISPNHLMSTSTILQLVDTMLMNQDLYEIKQHKEMMPAVHFRREFQTVKISLPRCSGHTTAALALWMKKNALVLYPRYRDVDMFLHDYAGRKRSVSHNKNDVVTNRCMAIENPSRFCEKVLYAYAGVNLSDMPELLVFDLASYFGYWRDYTVEVSQQMQKDLDVCIYDGDIKGIRELFFKVRDYTRRPEDIVEEITFHAFEYIPTLKGVVVLQ